MIYLDDTRKNIIKAKEFHLKEVSSYLNNKCGDSPRKLKEKFIKKNLKDLLIGKPEKLIELNKEFYDCIGRWYSFREYETFINLPKNTRLDDAQSRLKKKYNKLHLDIAKIVNYKKWFITSTKKLDYILASNLNVNTCTYCNRIYTNTMTKEDGNKVMRPQFDHWYPKSKFPLLALSFYNLIPSCSICNSSAKSDTVFNLDTHFHPYIDKDILSKYRFSYNHFKSINNIEIRIDCNFGDTKAFNTIKDLNLISMYNAHTYELNDLLTTHKAYSKSYLNNLKRAFPNTRLTDDEIYRLAFGTELEEKDFSNLPFSKFKKDILKELEII